MKSESKLELLIQNLHLNKNGKEISEATLLSDIEEYDSMSTLELILFVNETYGKSVDVSEIRKLKSIKDILLLMD